MRFYIFFLPVVVFGNSIIVNSHLDTTMGYIGDVFIWRVELDGTNERIVNFPKQKFINDTLTISDYRLIYNGKLKNKIGIEFKIIGWDTGYYATPDYSVDILNEDSTLDYSIEVPSINFTILSILEGKKQTNYQDMKGPVPVKPLFPIRILYIIILIALFIGIIVIWKKRQNPEYEKIIYNFIESPRDRAKRRLKELDSSSLSKEYYILLSHIIREYIERKYFIRTLEMTTKEIDDSRKIFPIIDSSFSALVEFLYKADKVKYAREIPKQERMLSDKEKIESFINLF